jgi:probable addiction module antidote protein
MVVINPNNQKISKKHMNFLNNGELKMTKSKSFNEYILNDLKTDEDIKEWINIGFQEFLQDNDLNAFVKALEYAVRAKDSILGISKKTGISRSNLYAIFNGEQQPQLSTALKIIKELGYTVQVA